MSGVVLTLLRGDSPISIALQPDLAAARTAAASHALLAGTGGRAALAAQQITADGFNALRIGITLLHDPALHGTVADPHLAGLTRASGPSWCWSATSRPCCSTRIAQPRNCWRRRPSQARVIASRHGAGLQPGRCQQRRRRQRLDGPAAGARPGRCAPPPSPARSTTPIRTPCPAPWTGCWSGERTY